MQTRTHRESRTHVYYNAVYDYCWKRAWPTVDLLYLNVYQWHRVYVCFWKVWYHEEWLENQQNVEYFVPRLANYTTFTGTFLPNGLWCLRATALTYSVTHWPPLPHGWHIQNYLFLYLALHSVSADCFTIKWDKINSLLIAVEYSSELSMFSDCCFVLP